MSERDGVAIFNMENDKFVNLMNLEMDVSNAFLMYNNGRNPNIVWPGEQGVENQNQVFNSFGVIVGKIGYTRAIQKLVLLQLIWNRRMLKYYLAHPDKLAQCFFSKELIDLMRGIVERERQMGDIMNIIYDKGIFVMRDVKDELDMISMDQVIKQCLEISEGEKYFDISYSQRILKFCVENAQSSTKPLLSKEKHLPQIKELFYQYFSDEFLMRRCRDWGYYFTD